MSKKIKSEEFRCPRKGCDGELEPDPLFQDTFVVECQECGIEFAIIGDKLP